MDHVNYFKDFFESFLDYRKIVSLKFLFKNCVDLLNECGLLKYDLIRLGLEFRIL